MTAEGGKYAPYYPREDEIQVPLRPRLLDLSELEDDLVPEILPASAAMSITAPVAKLRILFSRAAGVSPTKEVIPGTAFALLEAIPSSTTQVAHVRITASDGEQTVSVVEDGVSVKIPGAVLLPPRRVLDILKLAPTDVVDISVVGSTALVRSGRARWTVQVPVGEITDLSALADVGTITTTPVPLKPFLRALRGARVAASTSNARVSLMQVRIKDGSILACDGGRLHKVSAAGLDPSIDTTIPIRVVDELVRALDASSDPQIMMGVDDRFLVFDVGDEGSIVAQKMILPFPEMQDLILGPQLTNTLKLLVNRVELHEAIMRVRVNADPDIAVVVLSTVRGTRSADDWTLEVQSRDRSGNTAQESVECQWDGKPMSVAYNHHHLTDLLATCSSELLSLRLGNDTKSTKTPLLIEDPESGIVGVVQQVTQHGG